MACVFLLIGMCINFTGNNVPAGNLSDRINRPMFIIGGLIRFIIGPKDRNFADGERFYKSQRIQDNTGLAEGLAIKTAQG